MVSPSKRLRVLVLVIVAILAVVAVVVGLCFAVHEARRTAHRMHYSNSMREIGLALSYFEDIYGRLPPAVHRDRAGRPLSSWRFRLVPFLSGLMRRIEYDMRWDDPANRWLSRYQFLCFCWMPRENDLRTNVMAITGPGTSFDEDRVVRLKELPPDTVLAVEIASSGTEWGEPGDLDIGHIPESITQGVEGDGVHVLFADGEVWLLRADVPLGELRKFFTIEGAKRYQREHVLRPYTIHVRRSREY